MRPNLTDTQLAARACKGEDWAFEELAARHADMIDAKSAMRFATGEEHDDMHQAALFGLYRAACTYDPARGSAFRTWANLVVQGHLDSFLIAACRLKHQTLDGSLRFEQRTADGDATVGEMIPAPVATDPCAMAIAREEFQGHVEVLMGCTPRERAAAVWRIDGKSYKHEKGIDNSLQRVRRKLKAAA